MHVDELRSKEFKVFIPQVEINICAHEMKLFPCDFFFFLHKTFAITVIKCSDLHLYPELDRWGKKNHSLCISVRQ